MWPHFAPRAQRLPRSLRGAGVVVAIVLGPVVQASGPQAANPAAVQRTAGEPARLAELREAGELPELWKLAPSALSRLPRGSDEWIEVGLLATEAGYGVWSFDEARVLGEDVNAGIRERLQAAATPTAGLHGGLSPRLARVAVDLEFVRARLWIALGEDQRACSILEPLFRGLRDAPPATPSGYQLRSGVDLARVLHRVDRKDEGNKVLACLRWLAPGTLDAALASALLQCHRGGAADYRGKYDGDPRQTERMRAVEAARPAAERIVAHTFGIERDRLRPVPVGVVDKPAEVDENVALTLGDARLGAPPIVMLFAEALALDLAPPEELLVHELTHAALIMELGPAHDRLPPWAVEGFANWAAGELELVRLESLGHRLERDPLAFLSNDPLPLLRPDLVVPGAPRAATPDSGLVFLWLADAKEHQSRFGPDCVRKLFDLLRAGRTLDEAFTDVTGVDVVQGVRRAEEWLVQRQLATRNEIRDAIAAVEDARRLSPPAVVDVTRSLTARGAHPLVRSFAWIARARALETLGDPARALEAWEGLLEGRHESRRNVTYALLGRARCLVALRRPEARAALLEIERGALDPDTQKRALMMRAKLEHPPKPR